MSQKSKIIVFMIKKEMMRDFWLIQVIRPELQFAFKKKISFRKYCPRHCVMNFCIQKETVPGLLNHKVTFDLSSVWWSSILIEAMSLLPFGHVVWSQSICDPLDVSEGTVQKFIFWQEIPKHKCYNTFLYSYLCPFRTSEKKKKKW